MKHETYGIKDATFIAVGKEKGLQKIVDDFYHFMNTLPDAKFIRSQHPQELSVSADKLFCFLSGWMGGPKYYQEKYGAISIPGSHASFFISETEKQAWLLCMKKSFEKNQLNDDLQNYLISQLSIPANRIVATSKASFMKVN